MLPPFGTMDFTSAGWHGGQDLGGLEEWGAEARRAGYDLEELYARLDAELTALPDPVRLRRALFVQPDEEIDWSNLGLHWTWDPDTDLDFIDDDGFYGGATRWIIDALAPKSAVDLAGTAHYNLWCTVLFDEVVGTDANDPVFPGREIVLKRGSPVSVVGVEPQAWDPADDGEADFDPADIPGIVTASYARVSRMLGPARRRPFLSADPRAVP